MTAAAPSEEGGDRPIIRDKRRIDPMTGARRPDSADSGAGGIPGGLPGGPVPQVLALPPEVADLEHRLEERTADLQRVKAEYDNYRRRVERDRLAVAEQALGSVLVSLLPVLDDIGLARSHGELGGGFKSVAERLEATVTKLGLSTYGEVGEPFDPTVHEALMHSYAADLTGPTAVAVLQPGYRLGERILRPARVAVAEPEPGSEPGAADPTASAPTPEPAPEVSDEAPDEHA